MAYTPKFSRTEFVGKKHSSIGDSTVRTRRRNIRCD